MRTLGTLTSKPFVLERDFITFLIGGGNHPGKTCLNLLVDGKVVASATGRNDNRMRLECFDVTAFAGKTRASRRSLTRSKALGEYWH